MKYSKLFQTACMNGTVFLFLFTGLLACADDCVYLSNTGSGSITKIDPSGKTSVFASGLSSPEGLAFDDVGNLYVANEGNGTISQISPSGKVATFVSGLNSPTALTFAAGNLYVETGFTGGTGQQTILRIDSTGDTSIFATATAGALDNPYICSDSVGNIYINSGLQGFQEIIRFDSGGNITGTFPCGWNYVEGMAVDSAGNGYRGLQNADSISPFIGDGALLTNPQNYPSPYNVAVDETGFDDAPGCLAFDTEGNLFAYFYRLISRDGQSVSGIMEFGANGANSIVATGIDAGSGGYIAVQAVPEPNIPKLTSLLVFGLFSQRYLAWVRRTIKRRAAPVDCTLSTCLGGAPPVQLI